MDRSGHLPSAVVAGGDLGGGQLLLIDIVPILDQVAVRIDHGKPVGEGPQFRLGRLDFRAQFDARYGAHLGQEAAANQGLSDDDVV